MKDATRPPALDALCEVFVSLRDPARCRSFLEDLCTPAELRSLADRWQVARLLARGVPYRQITAATGVSTATVSRVARALSGGEGYRQQLAEEER